MHRTHELCALVPLVLAASACTADYSTLVPPTVDQDRSLPSVELNGTRLHLTTHGRAGDPLVVMLHGGPGGDHRSMTRLTALADDGFFVVQWDQRGAGLSRRHDCGEVDSARYLGDLEALVDRYAPAGAPVLFLGHSWGAMYATWFIDAHPTRVTSAVLLEPGGFTASEVAAYFQRMVTHDLLGEDQNDALFTGRFLTADDHTRADLLAATLFTSASAAFGKSASDPEPFFRAGGVAARCLPASAGDFDWTTHLSAYRREVLFVHGDQNALIRREHQEQLAAHYPKARLVGLTGAGHDLQWVKAPEIRALARDHFRAALAEVKP